MLQDDPKYSELLEKNRGKTFWYWSKTNSPLLSLVFFLQFLFSYTVFFFIFFWQDIQFLFTDFFVKILLAIPAIIVILFFFRRKKLQRQYKKILIWLGIFQVFFTFLALASPLYIVKQENVLIHIMSFIVKSKTVDYTIREFVDRRILGSGYMADKGRSTSNLDEKIDSYKKAIALNADYYNPYSLLAFSYLDQRNCDKSVQTMERVIEKMEKPDNPYIDDQGKAYYFSTFAFILQTCTNDNARIEKYYSAAVTLDSLFIETYINRSQYFLFTGQLNEAKMDLEKCIAPQVPNGLRSSCLTNLSVLAEKQGDIPQAKLYAKQAVELNDQNADAWNNYGYYLAVEGQIAEAIKCFQKALEINPNLKVAKENLKMYNHTQ